VHRDLVVSSKLHDKDRLKVAQTVVATIRAMGGRFLECKDETEELKQLYNMTWIELSDEKTSEITNHELGIVVREHTLAAAPPIHTSQRYTLQYFHQE
jgi:hypothetical protein